MIGVDQSHKCTQSFGVDAYHNCLRWGLLYWMEQSMKDKVFVVIVIVILKWSVLYE